MQAGVNCGVHCKCDECHNTVEDGLPPPPRPSGKQSASAAAALAAVANPTDRNKTSPGTPPAPCALFTLLVHVILSEVAPSCPSVLFPLDLMPAFMCVCDLNNEPERTGSWLAGCSDAEV